MTSWNKKLKMSVKLTTADLKDNYEIVDTIFALDRQRGGFISDGDPSRSFNGVKRQLIDQAMSLDCDAVIGCKFDYRNWLTDGMLGKVEEVEIFACGTAARILSST